jgi:hypothetical protein
VGLLTRPGLVLAIAGQTISNPLGDASTVEGSTLHICSMSLVEYLLVCIPAANNKSKFPEA